MGLLIVWEIRFPFSAINVPSFMFRLLVLGRKNGKIVNPYNRLLPKLLYKRTLISLKNNHLIVNNKFQFCLHLPLI